MARMIKNHINPDITETVITHDITVRGDLHSDNDVWVDGTIEGNLTAALLRVGQNAQINGDITAEIIEISGKVNGDISATEALQCSGSAYIQGNIKTPKITVESNAIIIGSIDMPQMELTPPDSDEKE